MNRICAPYTQPGEPIWSIRRKDGSLVECELRDHGKYGVEVQLFLTPVRERDFSYGRTWPSRDFAVAEAEEIRVRELHEGGTMIDEKRDDTES